MILVFNNLRYGVIWNWNNFVGRNAIKTKTFPVFLSSTRYKQHAVSIYFSTEIKTRNQFRQHAMATNYNTC